MWHLEHVSRFDFNGWRWKAAGFFTLALGGSLFLPACECGKKPPPPPASTATVAATASATSTVPSGKRPKAKVKLRSDVPRKCRTPCWVAGLCSLKGSKMCVAVSEADCRASHGCKVNGMCTFEGQACVGKTDEDCRKSERCKAEGLCAFNGEGATNCKPKTDADCAQSDVCKTYKRCKIGIDGYCDDPENPRKVPPKGPVPL